MTDDETGAIESLRRILSRAPKHLKGATTYEILTHLSEQGDAEADAALAVLTSPERIQWYRDLGNALTWDYWITSESGTFRSTDKSKYHDPNELVAAFREMRPVTS